MMKDVVISIRSLTGLDGEEDSLDFITDGLYSYDEGVACLTYLETEVTGLEGTRTSLMVLPDKVVVDRDGMLTGRMIFREGTRDSFPYNTPYGQMMLGIDTRSIRHNFNESGGDVEIDYVTDLAHTYVSRNKFRISVKEMEKANG